MKKATFHIFRGAADQNAVWVETVAGLENARVRMQQIAASVPEEYFVFGHDVRAIVARIDTRTLEL